MCGKVREECPDGRPADTGTAHDNIAEGVRRRLTKPVGSESGYKQGVHRSQEGTCSYSRRPTSDSSE